MCNCGPTRGSKNKAFDELVDRATRSCLAEPDWKITIKICSLIEQGKVTPRYALDAIKKKVFRSPYAISVLEIVTSNCEILKDYVSCYEFKESLRGIASRIPDQFLSNRLLSLAESSGALRRSQSTRSRPSRRVSSPQRYYSDDNDSDEDYALALGLSMTENTAGDNTRVPLQRRPPIRRRNVTTNGNTRSANPQVTANRQTSDATSNSNTSSLNSQTAAHRQPSLVSSNANNAMPVCVTCLDQPREYLFLDCGHLCTCKNCIKNFRVKEFREPASSVNRCPQCRTTITKKPLKVFL